MKLALLCAAAVAAVSLGGCAQLSATDEATMITKLLTDPACGHLDDLTFGAGTLGGANVTGHVNRTCPTPGTTVTTNTPAPAAPVAPPTK